MARDNRLWGAGRIRGDLRTLAIRVATATIRQYLRQADPSRPAGQPRSTVLRNRADTTRACDFLPVTELSCRPRYASFVVALEARRVAHVGVTRHPTDA